MTQPNQQRPQYVQRFSEDSFIHLLKQLRTKDLATPIAPASDGWTVSNYNTSRTLDASTATTSDIADFLCTLVDDLKTAGYLG